jgi:hypothetical protein
VPEAFNNSHVNETHISRMKMICVKSRLGRLMNRHILTKIFKLPEFYVHFGEEKILLSHLKALQNIQ